MAKWNELADRLDGKKAFSRNLLYWLRERSVSQSDLARRLHITQAAVSAWIHERNPVDVATIGRIAAELEIPAAWLLHDDADERSKGKPPTKRDKLREAEDLVRRVADAVELEVVRVRPKKPPPH